jgi:dGTPase
MADVDVEAVDPAVQQRIARRLDDQREPDQRAEGARDRDRILYASALRRLAGITQVVSSFEGAVFHNRLTHTYEVAQMARRLSEFLRGPETDGDRAKLADRLEIEFAELAEQNALAREVHLDPEVAEAAALAHDIGHPPFGHAAEKVLNDEVTETLAIADGFEGNAQSFRVVTRLAIRRGGVEGLNLTRATLDAILKYPWRRDFDDEYRKKKWGAFEAERETFDWTRAPHLVDGADPSDRSLEAEIMDWSDDVAYAVHDVDDFYRAGRIPLDRLLRREERDHQEFWTGLRRRWTDEGIHQDWDQEELEGIFEELMDLIDQAELRASPFEGYIQQRAALRAVTSSLIKRYMLEEALRVRRPDGTNLKRVVRPIRAEKELALLKELVWQYAILHPSLASQQEGKRAVVECLFDRYRDAAENDHPLLPLGVRQQLRTELDHTPEGEKPTLFARTATDIICSMTEQQAVAMYERITGHSLGSVSDAIL